MSEIRPVLPEIEYFLLYLLVHVLEGIKLGRQLEFRERLLLYSVWSAEQKKCLTLKYTV